MPLSPYQVCLDHITYADVDSVDHWCLKQYGTMWTTWYRSISTMTHEPTQKHSATYSVTWYFKLERDMALFQLTWL